MRTRINDLPFGIPNMPVFEGEDKLDATKEAANFLTRFAEVVEKGDWQSFGELFCSDDDVSSCWWKDSLTLTFDKRTLRGRKDIVEAWKTLSATRKPSKFGSPGEAEGVTDFDMGKPAFMRMGPTMASLDVPFRFTTEAPKSRCIGQISLIPKENNQWKIWILSTAVVSLEEHPFSSLPRQSPSTIHISQRGKAQAQGFPQVEGVLDAIVIGASMSGLSNTIMLDAIGANVAAFDMEPVVGGNWTTKRYDDLTLHHPAFMIQLPMFPVPSEGYPTFLTGRDLTRYYASAIETLKLPVFGGIKVLSNIYDEATKLWRVRIQDVQTGNESIVETRNIVISTGFLVSPDNPKFPELTDQHLFKGPVQHTTEYRTPELYNDKDVVIVGSGTSAHDVAQNLALNGAKNVILLQRSPSVLLDFEAIAPLITRRYSGDIPVNTADFLESMMPIAIMRDMARGAMAMIMQSQAERLAAFESKGYLVDRKPDFISRAFEERGRAVYMDQPKTFELVFNDRIKIARGEAKGFVNGGRVVHDQAEGKNKVLEADGVILATGYKIVDLPKQYAESGFIDAQSASLLENVSLFGVDAEGELPGYTTFSGRECLSVSFST